MTDTLSSSATINSDDAVQPLAQAQRAYTTAVADVDTDAEKIIALWRTGLRHNDMPTAKLDWYYRHNPEGAPLVVFLNHSDGPEPVGVAAVGPRRIRFGEQTLGAGALVDFVTRPEHRTFFPAIFLQKEISRRLLGVLVILFGFPNPKSLAIFRRVGYQCVGQLVRRARVLRSTDYLAKYLPGWLSPIVGTAADSLRTTVLAVRRLVHAGFQSRWQELPDAGFDELWKRTAAPDLVMGVRDAAFLRWRFVDVPSQRFRFFTVVSSVDGRLVAYAVCTADGAVLRVEDFLIDPTLPSAGARLWLDLSLEAIRSGYTSLSVEFLGGEQEQRQLHAAGLHVREQRPCYAAVAHSSCATSVLPTAASTWYMTTADCDW